MTITPGPRTLNDGYRELQRDAIRALREAGEAIAAAVKSGDDAVILWLGQQVAAATMTLERDGDMQALVLDAFGEGWAKRGAAMNHPVSAPLRLVAT